MRHTRHHACASHNYGEPFLDKKLVEKVRYAKARGIAEVGMIEQRIADQ